MRDSRLASAGFLLLLALLIAAGSALAVPAPAPPRGLRSTAAMPTGAESRPGFTTFGTASDLQVNVDPGNLVDDVSPAIAVAPSGVIAVVWNGDESQKAIWFSRSLDGGVTFQPALRVNDLVTYPPGFSVNQADVAVGSDGTIYVVWFDYRAWAGDQSQTSPIDVYLDRSTDGGVTWGTDVLVSTNGSGTYPWHFQPYLAIDPNSGNLYVSFTDYDRYLPVGDAGDISVARSVNGGASFDPKVRVDDLGALPVPQAFSSIAVDPPSGDVYVVFEDHRGSGPDIYLARSTDQGQTFGANHRVNADTTSLQLQPSVRVDGAGNIGVAWFDWRNDPDPPTPPNVNHIMFARSPAGGTAFGPEVQVTDVSMNGDPGFNFPPRLAIRAAGLIDIVWHDRRADTTFCRIDRSTDGGVSFGADELLHDDRGNFSHALPRLAIRGGGPVATWMDRRNGTLFDVFFTGPHSTTSVEDHEVAAAAISSRPNPFRRNVVVRFALTRPGAARVEVRDVAGRSVRMLREESFAAGEHAVVWDGIDASGRPVPSGVYFVSVLAGARTMRHKVVLGR